MKVVQINKLDTDGAGLCCYRIHKSLIRRGVESSMLVAKKTVKDSTVRAYNRFLYFCMLVSQTLSRKFGAEKRMNESVKKSDGVKGFYSLPTSFSFLHLDKAVRNADLVHIHWVNCFLDYPSFFAKVKKPIVMTLHDENLFYGIAHYERNVLKDSEVEKKYYDLKLKSISGVEKLGIVFLSKMMYDKYKNHEIVRNAKTTIIHNSVDCSLFNIKDKNLARKKYGIKSDETIFIMVANVITEERKGLLVAIEALEKLSIPKAKILAVGNNPTNFSHERVITTGPIRDGEELSHAYSSADYFIMPSMQEAFAQTPIEAMACGVPAVVFPVSGTEELMNDTCGVRCAGFSVEDLVEGIKKAMTTSYEKDNIREYVSLNFSPEHIADMYIDFYKNLL